MPHIAVLFSMLILCLIAVLTGSEAVAQPVPPEDLASDQLLIVIQRGSYDPPYPTLSVGTTVSWVNRDREQHTVTSDEGWFDGSLDSRGRFSFTFTEPGYYFYYCKPHDWMIGEITVE